MYQRMNFRTNINAGLNNRLNVGTNLQLSYAAQDKLSSKGDAPGIIRHALIRPPIIGVYKSPADPTYTAADPFTDLPFFATPWDNSNNKYEFGANPVALAFYTNDKRDNFKTFGNVFAEYALLTGPLKFRSNLGLDLSLTHNKAFLQNFGDDDGGGNATDGIRSPEPSDRLERRQGTGDDRHLEQHPELREGIAEDMDSARSSAASTSRTTRLRSADRDSDTIMSAENFQYLNYGGTTGSEHRRVRIRVGPFLFVHVGYLHVRHRDTWSTANFRADASSRFADNNSGDTSRRIRWLEDLEREVHAEREVDIRPES